MKKVFTFVAVSALAFALSSIASADNNIPGAYAQDNNAQVMGVGQTIMQMGAYERGLTNAANLASRAGNSRAESGVNVDYQFGSSQTEQSWKQWKTPEDAGVVVGLVVGDCRGDNSDDSYRKQMNDNRIDPFGNPYMQENLVSQADCEVNHATMNQNLR
ncbi:hypothetical protein OAT06_03070 [Nitrospinaceae bacterium]|nr:hypothetical protein [Nitrospinaceae bacterium]